MNRTLISYLLLLCSLCITVKGSIAVLKGINFPNGAGDIHPNLPCKDLTAAQTLADVYVAHGTILVYLSKYSLCYVKNLWKSGQAIEIGDEGMTFIFADSVVGASTLKNPLGDAVNTVGGAVTGAVDTAGSAIGNTASDVGNAATSAVNAVGGAATDAGSAIQGAASGAINAAGNAASDAGKAIQGAATGAVDAAGNAASDAGSVIGSVASDVGHALCFWC